MGRGVVLAADQDWTYVMTEDMNLVQLPIQGQALLGQEIELGPALLASPETSLTAKQENRVERRHIAGWRTLLAAACMLILLAGSAYLLWTYQMATYAVVSIDINPSLRLELNRRSTVIAAKAQDPAAAEMLTQVKLQGLPLQEAVAAWIQAYSQKEKNPVKDILIAAVIPPADAPLHDLIGSLKQLAMPEAWPEAEMTLIYSHQRQTIAQAGSNRCSIGYQMLINQSESQNKPWDAQTIKGEPLAELIQDLLHGEQGDLTGLQTASAARTITETIQEGATDKIPPSESSESETDNKPSEVILPPQSSKTGPAETSASHPDNPSLPAESSWITQPSGTVPTATVPGQRPTPPLP